MALCRCKNHPPEAKEGQYLNFVLPLGYPYTSSVCNVHKCNNPGLLFLNTEDVLLFNQDMQRIYANGSDESKIRVDDQLHYIDELDALLG